MCRLLARTVVAITRDVAKWQGRRLIRIDTQIDGLTSCGLEQFVLGQMCLFDPGAAAKWKEKCFAVISTKGFGLGRGKEPSPNFHDLVRDLEDLHLVQGLTILEERSDRFRVVGPVRKPSKQYVVFVPDIVLALAVLGA